MDHPQGGNIDSQASFHVGMRKLGATVGPLMSLWVGVAPWGGSLGLCPTMLLFLHLPAFSSSSDQPLPFTDSYSSQELGLTVGDFCSPFASTSWFNSRAPDDHCPFLLEF